MHYKQVTFEGALTKKSASEYVLIGSGLRVLDKNKPGIGAIVNGLPMSFEKINKYIKSSLDDLEYISFWDKVKIFEVV